jgi:hypothetical protein
MVMDSGLRTLLDIVPGSDGTLGRHLAWSRSLNLLACDLVPPPGSQTLQICIIDPSCPEVRAAMYILFGFEFSSASCPHHVCL